MNIKRNNKNGGFYTFFKHKGKFYFADLANTFDQKNECMIFLANENEEVTDWGGVYVNRDVEVTEKDLIRCVKDFCRETEE